MARIQVVGILWIRKTDYDRAVALSEDGMPATYEDWRKKMDGLIGSLPADTEIMRIEADPDEVAKWCVANGRRVDTKGRSAFAAFRASKNMQN